MQVSAERNAYSNLLVDWAGMGLPVFNAWAPRRWSMNTSVSTSTPDHLGQGQALGLGELVHPSPL
jgi:hypothetical protein